jgi:hypothetical protein
VLKDAILVLDPDYGKKASPVKKSGKILDSDIRPSLR